jgi:hypothetical protein
MTTRRNFIATTALTAVAVLLISSLSLAQDEEDQVQLMFVQTVDDLKADDETLRLVNVGKQTLYFSDRPKRIAGHLTMRRIRMNGRQAKARIISPMTRPTRRFQFMSLEVRKTRSPW